jgi:hypothetical protein
MEIFNIIFYNTILFCSGIIIGYLIEIILNKIKKR